MNEAQRWRAAIALGLAPRSDLEAWRAQYGGAAVKAVAQAAGGMMTAPGAAIKSVGRSGWTEGYLIAFGGNGDLSQFRDIFLKSTDYGRRKASDVYVHHRQLKGLGERMLANPAQLDMDDIGVFCKHLLDLSDEYEAALYKLVQAGKLRWSSGTAPHLVARKSNGDGTHTIKRWILGIDASYTPQPAGGLATGISAMKSLMLDALKQAPEPRREDLLVYESARVRLGVEQHEQWMRDMGLK